jgi:hypothetical protein
MEFVWTDHRPNGQKNLTKLNDGIRAANPYIPMPVSVDGLRAKMMQRKDRGDKCV